MNKIVAFDVRSFNLSPAAVEDGTTTRVDMDNFLMENYFSKGWELFNTHVTHSNGPVNIAVVLVKYADETAKAK